MNKHAAKTSSKRDIEITTSTTSKVEDGIEQASESQIENINHSRTLTYIWSRMLQEHITLLCLDDIRVAYLRTDRASGSLFTLTASGGDTDTFELRFGDHALDALPVNVTPSHLQGELVRQIGTALGGVSVLATAPGTFSIQFDADGVAMAVRAGGHAQLDLRREPTRSTYQEVTLSQLDKLLERVVVPDRIKQVRDGIIEALSNVCDHEDEVHAMIEERALLGADGKPLPNASYLRVPKGKISVYNDEATGTTIRVRGVILAAMRNVMSSGDSVFCEALLGQGEALDDYSRGLQDAAVDAKRWENGLQLAAVERQQLGAQLVSQGDERGVGLYAKAFAPAGAHDLALVTVPASAGNGDQPDG
jgi:hypothetical protein